MDRRTDRHATYAMSCSSIAEWWVRESHDKLIITEQQMFKMSVFDCDTYNMKMISSTIKHLINDGPAQKLMTSSKQTTIKY